MIFDLGVAWKLIFSLAVLAAALFARNWLDSLLAIVVTVLVLIAETMNSAIEVRCDFVHIRPNKQTRIIHDIAAAGLGIAPFA